MLNFLTQSSLVKTRSEQAADSKSLPLLPHYTSKSSHPLSCHIGPEMEAIKSMLSYAFEEEKTRWPDPKRRPWLSIPIPAAQSGRKSCMEAPNPALVKRGPINFPESNRCNERVLSGRRQRSGEKGRDETALFSKYLLLKMRALDQQYQHHLAAC